MIMIQYNKETCCHRQSSAVVCPTHDHPHHLTAATMLLSTHSRSPLPKPLPFIGSGGCFLFSDRFLAVVLVILLACFATCCHGSCNQLDRDSLISFSQAISGGTVNNLNWSNSGDDCCLWEGVGCDSNNDRVTRLFLPFKQLRGFIHPSIANLSSLTQLNLSHNWISGPLPDGFFTSLNELNTIDLSSNRLSGEVTASSTLPVTIRTLDLSSNHFNGTIQSSFLPTRLLNLLCFNISNNSFTGLIPSSICTNSSSLLRLDFSFNDFHGQIPLEFGDCPKLEVLRAGFNNLSGPLPNAIYSSGTLQEIFLAGNKLSGPIAQGITKLTNLRILSLYGNELTGSIPRDIGNLSNVEQLLLHINKFNGTLPPSLMNCTSLRTLNLRVNLL